MIGYVAVLEFRRYVQPFWHNTSVWRTDTQMELLYRYSPL